MRQRQFLDLLDLAFSDFKSVDPEMIGMVIITLHRTPEDEAGIQVGSNVAPQVVRFAINELMRSWKAGESTFEHYPAPPLRKVV